MQPRAARHCRFPPCMSSRKVTSDRRMHGALMDYRADAEDEVVDFANASLYLSAIQTILSVLACASTAILACWMIPAAMVSAVRTLTLTCLVGALTMRKPLRIGHVHGLSLVFSALRPAVIVYISCLVVETLLHTCTQEMDDVPSYRRNVFRAAVIGMMISGMLRAKRPLSETDMPFLITAVCLLVVAFLPPPAVSMQGPLCQSVSIAAAAERMLRALVFSCVYSLFVYISSPTNSQCGGTIVCIMRASAASVWILGAALPMLLFAVPQCGVAIWARLRADESEAAVIGLYPNGARLRINANGAKYNNVPARTPPLDINDIESNDEFETDQPSIHRGDDHATQVLSTEPGNMSPTSQRASLKSSNNALCKSIGPLCFKSVGTVPQPRSVSTVSDTLTPGRMAEIAASITDV